MENLSIKLIINSENLSSNIYSDFMNEIRHVKANIYIYIYIYITGCS
jgi:methionine salvage enolase-phosphatase E1